MANTYLTHTPNTVGNRRTFTMSVWMKISANTGTMNIMGCGGSSDQSHIQVETDEVTVRHYNGSANDIRLNSIRKVRDNNSWYHLVVRMDTTQATASDRMRIYLNGEQLTNWDNATYPSQNYNWDFMDNGVTQYIGRAGHQNYQHWNGLLSHFHWCDGYSYAPTEFGETDATTGEWKIKTSPSVTYGNNGFFILKDGNSVTDQSGNGNNFTVGGGNLTNTEDSPSNVFATMNALDNYFTGGTFTNGNNTVQMTNQPAHYTSTLGVSTGKWYWEGKMSAGNNSAEYNIVGVAPNVTDQSGYAGALGSPNHGVGLRGNGNVWYNDSQPETGWNTWNQGDIVMIALDLDNDKIFWGTNGTWGKSSDPVVGTNGFSLSGKEGSKSSGFWFPAGCCREISQTNTFQWNFGNGYFGTTAVSSAGTNASGIGIFEYDVPTGFTALSTKGLNL